MPKLKTVRSVRELHVRQKQVFVRVDFNVPIENGQVTDRNRITEALPTIRYLIEQGSKVILASHLGRPEGKKVAEFSLEPVASVLAELLEKEITLAEDCQGEGIEMMAKSLKGGEVLLLENLRFHAGEESNDDGFAQALARLAEVYVNDAFGTAHRKHASTYGVAQRVAERGCGLLVEKELRYLEPLVKEPALPFWAILGGSKVSDKIKTLEALLERVQGLVIGGAMSFAFIRAAGRQEPSGGRAPAAADVEAAGFITREARRRGVQLLLPVDFVEAFDIGPESVERFSAALAPAKTVFWNGPMGKFEDPRYARATFDLARRVADLQAVKIVGGGDTVSAIQASGLADRFDHLSTGGGAVLEYLEGKGLPGLEALRS